MNVGAVSGRVAAQWPRPRKGVGVQEASCFAEKTQGVPDASFAFALQKAAAQLV